MADKLYQLHWDEGVIKFNGEDDRGRMSTTHFFEGTHFWPAYQEWLDAGNTPEPADEPPPDE